MTTIMAICVTLLVISPISMSYSGNAFSVSAYTVEKNIEGTFILKETDLINQPEVWGGYFDGENFYVYIGLGYEGKNIEQVIFTTENGFFAVQNLRKLSNEETPSRLYVGEENRLVVFGDKFEIEGSSYILDNDTAQEETLLFWGTKAKDMSKVPEQATISATAYFHNGKTQTLSLTIDLSGPGAYGGHIFSAEFEEEKIREREYYDSIPIEACELIEDSVKSIADIYEYEIDGQTIWYRIFDGMEFDENRIFRYGLDIFSKSSVYITVIRSEIDGTFTGMIYRVPEHLIYHSQS